MSQGQVDNKTRAGTKEADGSLACADISLWEIAMLVSKGWLDPGIDSSTFCYLASDARGVSVLPITPEIAMASARMERPQGDPADRLIAATAVEPAAVVITIVSASSNTQVIG
jgi:PIN domain nuclease of toxin-antitoxin system